MIKLLLIIIMAAMLTACGGGSGGTSSTSSIGTFSLSQLADSWNIEYDNEGTYTLITIGGTGAITSSANSDFISGSFTITSSGAITATEVNTGAIIRPVHK